MPRQGRCAGPTGAAHPQGHHREPGGPRSVGAAFSGQMAYDRNYTYARETMMPPAILPFPARPRISERDWCPGRGQADRALVIAVHLGPVEVLSDGIITPTPGEVAAILISSADYILMQAGDTPGLAPPPRRRRRGGGPPLSPHFDRHG